MSSRRAFFPKELFERITEIRVISRGHRRARRRQRRPQPDEWRLVILAADHPARHIAGVGEEPLLMGNRLGLLGRILRV
jgi:hypothetical protein